MIPEVKTVVIFLRVERRLKKKLLVNKGSDQTLNQYCTFLLGDDIEEVVSKRERERAVMIVNRHINTMMVDGIVTRQDLTDCLDAIRGINTEDPHG